MSQDRPDIYVRHRETFLKDVSAGRTRPEEHEESGSVPRWKATSWVWFDWHAHPSALHALADGDWAGGSMLLHGKHQIKAWTKQQSIVANSSAEVELYAGNRAAAGSMGFSGIRQGFG